VNRKELPDVLRTIVPVLITVLVFLGSIHSIALPNLEKYLLDYRKDMVRELVRTAHQLLVNYEDRVQLGEFDRAEAQRRAIGRISALRYGSDNKDYFWLNDMTPVMIAHPYRPDLEGQNIADYTDPRGQHLFLDFVEVCEKKGEGFVEYMWQWKDDPELIVPKISYVQLFEPWGWIVGTGIYVEDVRENIAAVTRKLNRIFLLLTLLVLLTSSYIVGRGMKSETARRRALKDLRDSEERYRLLAENVRDVIWAATLDLQFLYISPSIERLMGGRWKKEEPFDLAKVLSAEDIENVKQIVKQELALGGQTGDYLRTRTMELQLRRLDGEIIWVEVTASFVLGPDGKPMQIVGVSRDINDRKAAETALLEANTIVNSSPAAAFLWRNVEGWPVEFASINVGNIFGYTAEEFIAGSVCYLETIHPDDVERVKEEVLCNSREAFRNQFVHQPYRIISKDKQIKWVEDRTTIRRDKDGRITHHQGIILDISERKTAEAEKAKLEEQLRQSQKMEAIGRLAGGVAHDFNNILTGILGFSQMIQGNLTPEDPLLEDILEINRAAERAALLTDQLLAFSRKQIIDPKIINLNEQIAHSRKMIQRLIGEDIRMTDNLENEIWLIKSDPGQIDQILLNLAVNARDAMLGGGRLDIETRNIEINENLMLSHGEVLPGRYVKLSISDTGCGMSEETSQHIFEPFFSTKPKGEGTGLGLSTVFGIVSQNKGCIDVHSEPEAGTIFSIYFPALRDREGLIHRTSLEKMPVGDETILVVEDEEMVRKLTKRVLEGQGYQVILASDGQEAIDLAKGFDGKIDLLLSDVILPKINGPDLYKNLCRTRPNLKALFMSGYTDNALAHHGVLEEGVNFIQKPFAVTAIIRRVREVLDY